MLHALPQTDPIARLWWRSYVGVLAVPICQGFVLAAAQWMLLDRDTMLPALGLPTADPGGVLNLLVVMVLLWTTVKVPSLMRRYSWTKHVRTLTGAMTCTSWSLPAPAAAHRNASTRSCVASRSTPTTSPLAPMSPTLPASPGVATAEDAVVAAQRIRAELRHPIVIADLPVEIDASVGVALAPGHGDDLTTLLKHADVAMYDAKRGGAGVVVYDLATDSREAQHLCVLAELRQAITAGELRLFYQPKSHTDGRIDEVEALVRWQHPTRGLLAPAEFVPLAERTSLIKQLTAWVIQEAARQCGRWHAEGRKLSIAVNVSARNLADDELIHTLTEAAATAGIPVQALQLEITETTVMTDPVAAGMTLRNLSRLGVHVSIDDFGVGYTSLSQLATLPVRALKIDRRFVTDMLTNPVDEILVRNVIHLAQDLGLDSIAEGVESPEVWARLTELDCDEIQGYVLTPPLPPAAFDTWLDDWQMAHERQVLTAS